MSRRLIRRALLASSAAAAMTAGMVVPAYGASTGWKVAKVFPVNSQIASINGDSASDAWAAGYSCANPCSGISLLVRHWTGSGWHTIASPGGFTNTTVAPGGQVVAGSSASNAWVFTSIGLNTQNTDALLWNGTTWSAPDAFPAGSSVAAATVFSPTDAWAFGGIYQSAVTPYVAHYDGTNWTQQSFSMLSQGASATSSSDIWVIGEPPGSITGNSAVEIAHWNGATWQSQTLPALTLPSGDIANPAGITAVTPDNVWADAFLSHGQGVTFGSVLLHWNGRAWKRVTVPYTLYEPGPITQDGHGGFWLTAWQLTAGKFVAYLYEDLAGHWSRTPVPSTTGNTTQISALAHIPATSSVWGSGELLPVSGNGNAQGVILKDGP